MISALEQRQQMKDYFQANKHRFAHYAAKQRDKLKQEMVVAYGGKCAHCSETDWEILTLDHINDDANVEKDKYGLNARGGHKHYSRLKQEGWPQERFQLLCYNCNAKKENKRRRTEMIERWGEPETEVRSHARASEGLRKSNSSGIKGVFWNAQKQRWQARVTFKGQGINCGFSEDIREAAKAYAEKAKEVWGQYAVVATTEEIQRAYELSQYSLETQKSTVELDL